jgi:glycerol-3-phosphate dehydrogenase
MNETQMMDTRMNLHALFTASVDNFIPGMKGANLANYVEFRDFIKNPQTGKIEGAVLFDKIKQKEIRVKSKVVVNCAGVHADEVRKRDNPETFERIIGAKGTHLMFKKGMLPDDQGIIIPKTKDGRLIFVINYLGQTMVGTTDEKCPITHHVQPDQTEIDFIISELKQVFGPDYDYQRNLISAWAGIRPLVKETDEDKKRKAEYLGIEIDPKNMSMLQKTTHTFKNSVIWFGDKIHSKKSSTSAISRNHVIEFSPSGLVSVMGGKWTTFRKIGEETVDMILREKEINLEPKYTNS